ncbi:MAG: Uncharacterised protein [Prochlorococcus marinus str. MIT 9215]|nr:MAG: Uncharacterised protein [Prochlorococcus marinus str. MIT 9215]
MMTLVLLIAMIFAAITAQPFPPSAAASGSTVPALVRLVTSNSATNPQPMKLPIQTQVQLRNVARQVLFPAQVAMGKRAKLPVTNSMPKSTMLAKPKGNRTEPKKGIPDWTPTVIARQVARARMAPE